MLHGLQVKVSENTFFLPVFTDWFFYLRLGFSPHSVSWQRRVQTQSASSTCAGTTTKSRQLPSSTVSSSSRSSKPSKSLRLSPTATLLPQLDQNSTSFRHWKNNTACNRLFYFPFYIITQLFAFFTFVFVSVKPIVSLWEEGWDILGGGGGKLGAF